MGIREQIIFPEIDYDAIDQVRGLDVIIATTAATDIEGFALLDALGMPFAADGRPGEVDKAAEEEERRKQEEAQQRADAEAAALEQLKEENPDAYAAPEKPEAGEEGEDAEGDAGEGGDEAAEESQADGQSSEDNDGEDG